MSDNGKLCAEFFESKNSTALAQSMKKVLKDKDYKAELEHLSANLSTKYDILLTAKEIECVFGV